MKLKHIKTAIPTLALAAALALTGCGSAAGTGPVPEPSAASESPASTTEDAFAADLLAQIQQKGEIVIATEGTWSPWTYHDESDTLVGFDIEVAQAVAEKLGVTATFVEGEWDGLLAGLETGRYDTMANGVEITPERSEKYNFSAPYGYIRTAVITGADNTDINSLQDLAGKTTANTLSSTYAELAESYGANTTGVDDLNQTIELLLAGRVDATLNADVTFFDYMKAHPDAPLKVAVETDQASQVAFPVPKVDGAETLLAAINTALDELRADGTLAEISVKYFDNDITAE